MVNNIKKIINSDAAYEILDNSNSAGSTWTSGGCAILAQALNMLEDYPIYVIYNRKFGSAEHFGVVTPSGSVIDADGEHKNSDAWLNFFKENETVRPGSLVVVPFGSDIDMDGIHFDEEASKRLVELIQSYNKPIEESTLVDDEKMLRWFNNSKMKDEVGNPVVFYHGVGKAGIFDEFREDLIGATSGNHGHFGKGFYFTDSKSAAKNFSEFFGGTGEVIQVYLKIINPFIVSERNLIKLGEKYNLNLPNKIPIAIDIDDLLSKLKTKDEVAYELLKSINKYKDYSRGWKEFLDKFNGEVPKSSIGLDLNTVSDWYEDTIGERYDTGKPSDYTIEELRSIGIEPKIIYDYEEDVRLDYMTNLGQNTEDWTNAIKKEGYDGIIAGDEIVVFKPSQIKSVNNSGEFNIDNNNILSEVRKVVRKVLNESLMDVDSDVDYIYDKFFKKDYDYIKESGNLKYANFLTDTTHTSILTSPLAIKANKLNPCKIIINVSFNYYKPKESLISIGVPNNAVNYITSEGGSDMNIDIAASNLDTIQAHQLRNELKESTIKGSIHHELSHWIDDTLHNYHIKKKLSKALEKNIKSNNKLPINAHYLELQGQIHNIYQLKQKYKDVWDDMSFEEMISYSPALSSVFKQLDGEVKKKWLRDIKTRMYREELLGKDMISENVRTVVREVLNETMEAKFDAYHGSVHKISKFEDSFLAGEKVTQHHGAGIYFTTNIDNARMFGKNVYRAYVEGRFIDRETTSSKVNIEELILLMKMSDEEWEMEAQNYNEDPNLGIRIAAQEAIDYAENEADVFLRVQSSWYQYKPLDYVRNMTKLGYDGMVVDAPSDFVGDKHIIVFNPDAIKLTNSDEIKNEAKNILSEEVLEETQIGQKDFEKLTTDTLKLLADAILREKEHMVFLTDNEKEPITSIPAINTSRLNAVDGFNEIGEFVKSTNIQIVPTTIIGGRENLRGELEYGKNAILGDFYKIRIKYSKEDLQKINNIFNEKITANDIYIKLFYIFYQTILHELIHAYDAWRSSGKAFGGQFKKSYTSSREKASNIMKTKHEDDALTPEEYEALNNSEKAYLNLIHEINARYAQAMQRTSLTTIDIDSNTFDDIKKDWDKVYKEFKTNFEGWRHLSDKMKRKLTRRVAKAYQEAIDELGAKKEKNNKKDFVIAENSQTSLFEVRKIIQEILKEI